MIHWVERKQLDCDQYDAVIQSSEQSVIYGYSWYLDMIADDWSCLVLGDYEAVMPIPFMRIASKLYLKKILQPTYCQQLGLFSKSALDKKVLQSFYHKFISLKPNTYHFNAHNTFVMDWGGDGMMVTQKNNFILSLSDSYETMKSRFSKNLKRNLAKAKKAQLKRGDSVGMDVFIAFKKKHARHKMKMQYLVLLETIGEKLIEREMGFILGVFLDEEMVGCAFFMQDDHRLIHLSSAINERGRVSGAMPYLFDALVQKYAETNLLLDFEGSMIPGVARFFKSFGSVNTPYFQVGKL